MISELVAGVLGFCLASLLLPLVIRWAREQSLLDVPDDVRRRHASPTPRLGGVAVFIAIVLAAATVFVWEARTSPTGVVIHPLWPGILFGAAIVFVIGLIDD